MKIDAWNKSLLKIKPLTAACEEHDTFMITRGIKTHSKGYEGNVEVHENKQAQALP